MTAVIVDDEAPARAVLREMLARHAPEVNIVAEASSIAEAHGLITQHAPALLFLDVHMPGGDGFELLKQLGTWDFDVIFTTASQNHAIQAIRFSALDYLVKPVHPEDLRAAMDRYIQRNGITSAAVKHQFLSNIQERDEKSLKLTLTHGDRTHAVPPEDIAWCAAERNYTTLHLRDDRRFMSARPLKEYDEMLSPFGFIRIHKSSLVNRNHVAGIDGDGHVRMRNGTRMEISRRRLEEVTLALRS